MHNDHLGTPRILTNANQEKVWEVQTTPFGEVSEEISQGITQLKGFPGQMRDSETGYSDNWHRTYDASLGRYLQSDPIGLNGGINTYAYVGGNPLSYTDPTGEYAVVVGVALLAVGAYAVMSGYASSWWNSHNPFSNNSGYPADPYGGSYSSNHSDSEDDDLILVSPIPKPNPDEWIETIPPTECPPEDSRPPSGCREAATLILSKCLDKGGSRPVCVAKYLIAIAACLADSGGSDDE